MKIPVSRLKERWKTTASVCPTQTPRPQFQCVRLDIGQGSFALSATDGEIFVRSGECAEPEFSRLLPAKRFGRLLDVANHEEIGFAEDVIKCGTDVWELSAPDVADWCFEGITDVGRQYWVDAKEFQTALQIALLAVDAESMRYALGGCLLDFTDEETVSIVATDGRRLACVEVACECSGDADSDVRPVVPAKAMKTIIAALPRDGKAFFRFGTTGGIVVDAGESVIHSRLLNGAFPKWQAVMPTSPTGTYTFAAGEMSAALKAAAIVSNEESRGVDCTLDEAGITATATGADVGRSRVSRGGLFGGSATFTINPDYVIPLLTQVGGDCELDLAYTDSESPLLLTHDGGLSYVLMPLSRE